MIGMASTSLRDEVDDRTYAGKVYVWPEYRFVGELGSSRLDVTHRCRSLAGTAPNGWSTHIPHAADRELC